MKRTLPLTSLSVIMLTGVASAMTLNAAPNTDKIERYAPGIEVSDLTDAQIGQVLNIIDRKDDNIRDQITAYLNDQDIDPWGAYPERHPFATTGDGEDEKDY